MNTESLVEKYRSANNKLILLDYDGTLVNFKPTPREAVLPEEAIKVLHSLSRQPNTKLVLITGRSFEDIDQLMGKLPVDIVADHGAMIKENGEWKTRSGEIALWKQEIFPLFTKAETNCPGSFIEEKRFSLTWHYRNTKETTGYNFSRELIRELQPVAKTFELKIVDGNKIIEVMPRDISKGNAAIHLLTKNSYDYVLSIGDDKTDEDMFEALSANEICFTIKVGPGDTVAKYKLNNVSDVVTLLQNLSA